MAMANHRLAEDAMVAIACTSPHATPMPVARDRVLSEIDRVGRQRNLGGLRTTSCVPLSLLVCHEIRSNQRNLALWAK